MQRSLHYPLANRDSLPRWRKQLLQRLPLESVSPETYRVNYYDSFDWRLFRANKVLQWQQRNDPSLCLHSTASDGPRTVMPLESQPAGFANALPPGQIREELDGLLGLRALLPVVTTETRSLPCHWIDKEGKTRLRVFFDHHKLVDADGNRSTLCKEIRVVPLQGYAKTAKRVTSILEEVLVFR